MVTNNTASQASIVSQMRQALAITEPNLDTSVGTPVRAILDVAANQINLSYLNSYLSSYTFDISSKNGADLDNFCATIGGIVRYPAKRAVGVVTFARQSVAQNNVTIQVGSQISTPDGTVIVATMVPAVLTVGETQISVPVVARVPGANSNVGANTLTSPLNIAGFSTVTNLTPMVNGTDAESDDQLRQRYRTTAFRNMAGTEPMFLGIALDNAQTSRAAVIDAAHTWREQIYISGRMGTSTVPDAKYVYPNSSVFGAAIDSGQIAIPGVQYTFSPTIPPTINVLDPTIPDGAVYDLVFKYTPTASRNVPTAGITNRVDIYVDGVNPTVSNETLTFLTANQFNNNASDPLYYANFQRTDTFMPPQVGSYFIKYFFGPLIEASNESTLTIGGVTYNEGHDYYLVNDVSANGGTFQSNTGVEFLASTTPLPPNNTQFSTSATYNSTPGDIQTVIDQWKLVTTDVQVHQALPILLNVYMAVILRPGSSVASIQSTVAAGVGAVINQTPFDGYIQITDILSAVLRVESVLSARFINSLDNATSYGIQSVTPTGTVLTSYADTVHYPHRAMDIPVSSNTAPLLNSLTLVQEAQNNFGAP